MFALTRSGLQTLARLQPIKRKGPMDSKRQSPRLVRMPSLSFSAKPTDVAARLRSFALVFIVVLLGVRTFTSTADLTVELEEARQLVKIKTEEFAMRIRDEQTACHVQIESARALSMNDVLQKQMVSMNELVEKKHGLLTKLEECSREKEEQDNELTRLTISNKQLAEKSSSLEAIAEEYKKRLVSLKMDCTQREHIGPVLNSTSPQKESIIELKVQVERLKARLKNTVQSKAVYLEKIAELSRQLDQYVKVKENLVEASLNHQVAVELPVRRAITTEGCDSDIHCSGHGACWNGECACAGGFTGVKCHKCIAEWDELNWPNCTSYTTFQPIQADWVTDSAECNQPLPLNRLLLARPFVRRQIPQLVENLRMWSIGPGTLHCDVSSEDESNTDLLFLSDTEMTTEQKSITLKALGPSVACFKNVFFESANIEASKNGYGGLNASGPNELFYYMFRENSPFLEAYTHMLWMEPDVYAVQYDWLDHVRKQIDSKPWAWVLGAIYVGFDDAVFRMASHRLHINGNAVYALQSICLRQILTGLKVEYPYLAWDLALDTAFRGASRKYRRHYVICDFIANVWKFPFSVSAFASTSILLVHGKNFLRTRPAEVTSHQCIVAADQLYLIANTSLVCESYTHHLFVRLDGHFPTLLRAYLNGSQIDIENKVLRQHSSELLYIDLPHPIHCARSRKTSVPIQMVLIVDNPSSKVSRVDCGLNVWFHPISNVCFDFSCGPGTLLKDNAASIFCAAKTCTTPECCTVTNVCAGYRCMGRNVLKPNSETITCSAAQCLETECCLIAQVQ